MSPSDFSPGIVLSLESLQIRRNHNSLKSLSFFFSPALSNSSCRSEQQAMQGLLIHAIVHAADIQDRDGGAFVMATMFGLYPFCWIA